jgi:iron complex outermembrane recepter protein
MRVRSISSLVISAFSLCAVATPGWGADNAADTPADAGSPAPGQQPKNSDLSEVVVTAQRREEASSKVPVTITAFTGDMLAEHSVSHETDLQSLVPGLTVKTGASANQIDYAIRGQTLDAFSGSPPGVLPYMNDVALPTHTDASVQFYDMGTIQVLKGPQGTLFGRNDTGGAVLFNTAQPTDEFAGYLSARFGNYSTREYQGAINIPLIPGKLDIRIAGDSLQNTGYVVNLLDGIHLGDNDAQSGRLSIKYTPFDGLTDTAVVQYNHGLGTENNPLVYSVYTPGQTNSDGQVLNSNAYAFSNGAIVPYLALQQSRGYLQAELLGVPSHNSHGTLFQNTTVYDLTSDIQIKNILGLSQSDSNSRNFFSGAPFQILNAYSPSTGDGNQSYQVSKSEELQVLGKAFDQQLKYIAGVYVSGSSDHEIQPLEFGPVPPFEYDYRTTDVSKAVFAQGTYDLSRLTTVEGLSFTAGIRYTWERLGNSQGPHGLFAGGPDQNFSESDPSWQLGLNWQLTPQELLYVVTRGSWRSGGFTNADPVGNLNEFKGERTHDVEVGSKFAGRILDHSVNLDISVYDQKTDDVQRDFYVNINGIVTGITANVPQSEVKGVELNTEIALTNWLRFGTIVAYTNAVFSKPVAIVLGQSFKFPQFADTPRWTGSVYGAVDLPVPDTLGGMTFRADAYSQSSEYFSSINLPGTQISGHTLVNLRYDWKNILNSHASVGVYVRNLLDRDYLLGGFALGATIGENLAIGGEPRTEGIELNYKF